MVLNMIRILLLFTLFVLPANAEEILSLSLEEAKVIALENNRDIKIQKENIEFSEGDVTKEKGAFDPFFTLTSTYSDIQSPTISTFVRKRRSYSKRFYY